MTNYGFYVDTTRCTGCKTCSVACKENNDLPLTSLYRRVYEYQGGSWKDNSETGWFAPDGVFGYHVSISCNHCASPACVETCPTGAMSKDENTGIVSTDHDVCIGCKTCQTSCPYDAPSYDEQNGYMLKCDLCAERVATGQDPWCVLSCPMRALDWGDIDELKQKYGEGNVEIEPLPGNITSPTLVLKPHKDAEPSGRGTGDVMNLAEEF